ncbi:hypothetical protein TELCIR_08015 [Teladorsagia circumcincta]|uniref:Uncharacterized protein n=1 Tax=Teladorsagia circumcincta TaxID=45464 RepID=A0A2G9UJ19_TELCI|nr:hypothetical protein TELCIR_08015 [Teladorsagia circumcincta]
MNTTSKEEYPRLTERDPSDIKKMYEIAFDQAIHTSWSDDTWKNVPHKKSLILLPDGFQPQCAGLEYPTQMAYCYTKPEDIRSEWFEQELSAVILFTEPTLSRLSHWLSVLHNILKAVATGAEWIIVPGPYTDREWEKTMDQIRDIAEGTMLWFNPGETLCCTILHRLDGVSDFGRENRRNDVSILLQLISRQMDMAVEETRVEVVGDFLHCTSKCSNCTIWTSEAGHLGLVACKASACIADAPPGLSCFS